MVHSTTLLPVPHADSTEPGLRLREASLEPGLSPSFADLFSRTRAEQSAPKPAPIPSRAPVKAKPQDDTPASSVEDTVEPEMLNATEHAHPSEPDKTDEETGKENEETHEDDETTAPEPTPRAALPVDLPPIMTVAVVKATPIVANAAPAVPTTAIPTPPAMPVTPALAAQTSPPAQATKALTQPTLPATVSPAVSTLPVPGENGVPFPAIPNTEHRTPNAQASTSSDFPGVPMDSNALAATAAPASGVELALPPTASTVAHAAPAAFPLPSLANTGDIADKPALSQTLIIQPTVIAQAAAPAAKTSVPNPTLTIPVQPKVSPQTQVVAKPAAPVPAENAPQPTSHVTPNLANTPSVSLQGASTTKAETAPSAPVYVPIVAPAENQKISAPASDQNGETRAAQIDTTPISRAVSIRPNTIGVPSVNAAAHAVTINRLPLALATAQTNGIAASFAGAATVGQTDATATATANPLVLATTATGVADVPAFVKAIVQNAAPEPAVPTPTSSAINTVGAMSGRQAETGAGAQNDSRNDDGGSDLSKSSAVEAVSGTNKTDNTASVNSYAAAVDRKTTTTNTVSAASAETQTPNTEHRDRIRLVAQVTKHLESLRVHENGGEMALRLRPDHLGSLRVSISTHSDSVVARIVAEHTGVQQALESAKNELRQALESKGLHLDRLEVTVQQNGADGRSAFGNTDSNTQNPSYRSAMRGLPRTANVPDAATAASASSSRRTDQNALLDRVA